MILHILIEAMLLILFHIIYFFVSLLISDFLSGYVNWFHSYLTIDNRLFVSLVLFLFLML
jgi:hypothetical protein